MAYRTGRHDPVPTGSHTGMIVKHAKILPKVGTGYPEKPGQIMSIEKKL